MPALRLTAGQVAEQVQGRLVGPADVTIGGVASLMEASADHLSFLGNDKYRGKVATSRAGVTLVPPEFEELPPAGRAYVVCGKPSAAFSQFVVAFAPPPLVPEPGVHPQATVAPGVAIPASTHVGPHAVIEPGATIGEHTVIAAGCYIGHGACVGSHSYLYPHVTIRERCLVGDRVIIHSSTVVGSDGFGFEPGPDGHKKIPQYGIVQIDDDVELGACVAVDRARFGRTWIKRGVKVDNLVQIAHNVVVGEHTFIVAQVGIAGSTTIGRGVILAGQAGLPGHIEVGDGAIIMAKAGPMGDVEPKAKILGAPGMPHREYLRCLAYYQKLPDMAAQLKALEKQVAELKAKLG